MADLLVDADGVQAAAGRVDRQVAVVSSPPPNPPASGDRLMDSALAEFANVLSWRSGAASAVLRHAAATATSTVHVMTLADSDLAGHVREMDP